MKMKLLLLLAVLSFSVSADEYTGSAHVIKGEAEVKISTLFTCENGRSRLSPVGIKTTDGQDFIVPANVQYEAVNFVTNLYDKCSNITPKSLSDVDVSSVPIIEVDSDGEIITGYIFADNYFELFINGTLIGVDPVPFTPFNSTIVRFKVKTPYDIAIKAVDWEENSGLGSENNRGKNYHPGDGGFIASFSDGTKTNSNWSAQAFYTSPIYDLSCATDVGAQRLTKTCDTNGRNKYEDSYSLHWDIPTNWKSSDSYTAWPSAVEFTESEIGVNNKKSYMNFREKFAGAGASFIWSSNVVLDNLVLFRYHVQ